MTGRFRPNLRIIQISHGGREAASVQNFVLFLISVMKVSFYVLLRLGRRGRSGKDGGVIEGKFCHLDMCLPPVNGVWAGVTIMADVQVLGHGEVGAQYTSLDVIRMVFIIFDVMEWLWFGAGEEGRSMGRTGEE